MAYQYPPPQVSTHAAQANMSPVGYGSDYRDGPPSSNSASMEIRSTDGGVRKDSFPLASQRLKHSTSTPDVRPLQSSTTDASQLALAADKRRNKLGYHRTSVACGHCRRRKIRCIPSTSDVQGRCVNCIRLKKECSFFPVDQQPTADTRPKAPSRASTSSKMDSASPSPALAPRHAPEGLSTGLQYSPLDVPGAQNVAPQLGMKITDAEGYSSESKLPSSASSRHFDMGGPQMQNWMAAEGSPNPATRPLDSNASWRAYAGTDSPITPSFSPYTPNAPNPPAGWASASNSEHGVREDIPWTAYAPAPPRAVSYSSESHVSPPYQSIQQQGRPFERTGHSVPADMYPQSVQTNVTVAGSGPVSTMTQGSSVPGGVLPSNNYGSWQQQYQFSRPSGEGYGNWAYGDQGSHPSVHPSEQIPTSNDHPAQPVGMYYSGR
ncbi:hypothetical protein BN1708_000401 [Verticillium longisporum]|uniref:Zn(2)-C6 fungal-type domain-containing protein n=1 Tax=Verticillium longisporum TaxID=100787 RepID=A0A0G4LCJ9_VERLO|nr:hypothetical protein BN1708_000401 [Verticillium longisporum]